MRRFPANMTAEDRRVWRRWAIWWYSFYGVIVAGAVLVGALLPAPDRNRDEVAQAAIPARTDSRR